MNYKNANHILRDRLVQEIQQYVQGEYIYIPIKDKVINTKPTEYGGYRAFVCGMVYGAE